MNLDIDKQPVEYYFGGSAVFDTVSDTSIDKYLYSKEDYPRDENKVNVIN